MSFGGAKTTQTSQQQTAPWQPAQQGLQSILGGAQNWLQTGNQRQFFPGQTYAGMSDPTKAGMDQLAQGGGANTQASGNYYGDVLSGKYMNAGNPYFQGMANTAISSVMPSINSTFSKAGMSGSDPHQYNLTKGLTDAVMPYAFQNYNNGLSQMASAAQQAPQLDMQTAGNKIAAGQLGEGYTQKGIDEAIARHNYAQNLPLQTMQEASGLINPIAGMGSQSSGTTTSQQQASPMQTALGMGLMGASMFGTNGMFPGAMSKLGDTFQSAFASPSPQMAYGFASPNARR